MLDGVLDHLVLLGLGQVVDVGADKADHPPEVLDHLLIGCHRNVPRFLCSSCCLEGFFQGFPFASRINSGIIPGSREFPLSFSQSERDVFMKDYYKINEIAKLYGIGVDSLRYYERLGILKPRRDTNGYRLYSPEGDVQAEHDPGSPAAELLHGADQGLSGGPDGGQHPPPPPAGGRPGPGAAPGTQAKAVLLEKRVAGGGGAGGQGGGRPELGGAGGPGGPQNSFRPGPACSSPSTSPGTRRWTSS